jgi:hypothetical protein
MVSIVFDDIIFHLTMMSSVDRFTGAIIVIFVGVICWFLKEVANRGDVALLYAPFLTLGGLSANYWAARSAILLSPDHNTNTALAASAGVLGMLLVLMATTWLYIAISDRLRAHRKAHLK